VNDEQHLDVRDYFRHSLATLGYRGGKVLRGAPEGFGLFRVGETSRTPSQILAHLCDLLDWTVSLVSGREVWGESQPGPWGDDVKRFHETLRVLDGLIAERDSSEYQWTRVFQGPIADAFTHVGQIALLRRLAGGAVRGENYFKADIVTGRVGAEQAAPRREFD